MSDDLLPWYNRELAHLRRAGAEFAEAHPKIAGRLRLGTDTVEDPHVSRLIESVAFLNARVRRKLDDDFPELTHALLGVLYPHYLAPVPSMAIARMVPAADLASPHVVPSGALLETPPVDGEPCRFRTTAETTLWPFEVESAKLTGRPILAPQVPAFAAAVASLRVVLRARNPDVTFAALAPESLRFFLRGPMQVAAALRELLLNDVVGVAVAAAPDDVSPAILDASSVAPAGFALDEGMVPYPASSFPGYRLLTEYFVFPHKFLFVDLNGLGKRAFARAGGRVELFFYLRRSTTDLEQEVGRDSLALGCVPIVNLFPHTAEPVEIDPRAPEVRVVPDARRPLALEVWSVDSVSAAAPDGTEEKYAPFYSARHASRDASRSRFWFAERRPAARRRSQPVSGTDVHLTLVDLDFRPSSPEQGVLQIETTCINRDLPARLPFGGDQPRLQFVTGAAPLERIQCLTQPTATLRPSFAPGHLWRLISHLSLNHLSLAGGDAATEALREILVLYDFRASAETRATAEGLVSVSCTPATARAPAGAGRPGGICRGIDVRIELDPARFPAGEAFLFAEVLERFFALYCSVNSFTRTTVALRGREGVLRRWAPRAGERALV
ncbi:MAG: type VI secretion system baseplate subunit TssF [Planctomycetes bacterium]|nr:type VI secretion system baseplate subunit TssF [Planctomycetota bacterium]